MEKVIITASVCGSIATQDPDEDLSFMPTTPEAVANVCVEAVQAGAAVVHVHGPARIRPGNSRPTLDIDGCLLTNRLVRERCGDVIIQFGLAGMTMEQRRQLVEARDGRPDMMSTCLTQHDYQFTNGLVFDVSHSRPELEESCAVYRANGVKPEFEVFHLGALFNLEWLATKELIDKPYWLTLFISPRGGVWSPPSPDELLHRVRNLPQGVLFQSCAWSGTRGTASVEDQVNLLTTSMVLGGHVRVGLEDNEYQWWDGRRARSNGELVAAIARVANAIGRGVASPAEARAMMGMPGR